MQDLIETLFCDHPEIPPAVARFCDSQPDYVSARQQYEAIASKIEKLVGYELFDELESAHTYCVSYEVNAYYRFGLGLREAITRRLGL